MRAGALVDHWRVLAAGFRFQVQTIRTNPDYFIALATTPLFAIVFLSIVRHAGRDDLAGYAVLAPVLISLWRMSTDVSGELIGQDRGYGTLEQIIATPASYPVNVGGRVLAVSVIGISSLVEVWIVARVFFGITLTIHHPAVFVATMAAAIYAMSGTALIMAALFALGRSTRIFQQTLTYPFYLLGGVIVPVATLPDWVEPLSRVVFLSWTSDLLRASLERDAVDDPLARITVILGLGSVGIVLGAVALRRALLRVQRLGTMTYV